jgi:hypothetical protein
MSLRPFTLSQRAFAIAATTIVLSLWSLAPMGGDPVAAQLAVPGCEATGDYRSLGGPILLGSKTTAQISFRVDHCSGAKATPKLIVVLALDASAAIEGSKKDMRDAASVLLGDLDVAAPKGSKFGVVAFSRPSGFGDRNKAISCPLTSNISLLTKCLKIDPAGQPDIGAGLRSAETILNKARGSEHARKIIVLFSDGKGPTCPSGQAVNVSLGGTWVMGVGVGQDVDESCMKNIVSSPNYYFRDSTTAMHKAAQIALERVPNGLEELLITHTIGTGMIYVLGSADPEANVDWDDDSAILIWKNPWSNPVVPSGGMTLSFTVAPSNAGNNQPISQKIEGSFTDKLGNRGRIAFDDIPRISVMSLEQSTPIPPTVIPPTPSPVPTAEPPTAAPIEPAATIVTPPTLVRPEIQLLFPMIQKGECSGCPDQNSLDPE